MRGSAAQSTCTSCKKSESGRGRKAFGECEAGKELLCFSVSEALCFSIPGPLPWRQGMTLSLVMQQLRNRKENKSGISELISQSHFVFLAHLLCPLCQYFIMTGNSLPGLQEYVAWSHNFFSCLLAQRF